MQILNLTEQLQMMNLSLKNRNLMNPNCLSRLMNYLKSCLSLNSGQPEQPVLQQLSVQHSTR